MKTTVIPNTILALALATAVPSVCAQETKEAIKKEVKEAVKEEMKGEAPKPGTVASVIHDGVTFSTLTKLVKAAGLEETLSGKGPYTVFGPTDEAFAKLPAGALEKLLLPENKEKARLLVTYHVIPGQYLAADLKDGDLTTLSGDKVKVDVENKDIEIDDSKLASTDVSASNGVFHSIDKVLVPKSLDGFAGLDHDD